MMLGERFWSKVDKTDPTGCWLWMAAQRGRGYGCFTIGKGKPRYAHRLSYEETKGAIPRGLDIDHLCRNHLCVNPDHLEAVTRAENLRRGVGFPAEEFRRMCCPKGHPLSGANLDPYSLRRGHRVCKTCKREADRKRYWREHSLW